MLDITTFLTTLYVMADDFCKAHCPDQPALGRNPSLTAGEVVALTTFGQWQRFRSEADFYRYAQQHLRGAFPTLPDRSQFNRLQRHYYLPLARFSLYLATLSPEHPAYQALDSSGVAVRDFKRRGWGWLSGQVNIGWSNRVGWYEGFHLLTAVTPQGWITGYSFAEASVKDQLLAEDFFAYRACPHPRLPTMGTWADCHYVVDKGFEGQARQERWAAEYGAVVVCPPKRNSKRRWPKKLRQWVAGLREIVEGVYFKLHDTFRLSRERPHCLEGFQVRLAAKLALHNFCCWLNTCLGRPTLAFADLLGWE
jgi:hypothetical protein